jgi:hypothetical protein
MLFFFPLRSGLFLKCAFWRCIFNQLTIFLFSHVRTLDVFFSSPIQAGRTLNIQKIYDHSFLLEQQQSVTIREKIIVENLEFCSETRVLRG